MGEKQGDMMKNKLEDHTHKEAFHSNLLHQHMVILASQTGGVCNQKQSSYNQKTTTASD